MAYCRNCGAQIDEKAVVCVHCGRAVAPQQPAVRQDKGGFLWGLLGFLVPLVGFILWIMWHKERPNTGKAAGIGAIIGVALSIVLSILACVAVIGLIPVLFDLLESTGAYPWEVVYPPL